jgi:flagellar biosynthesis component FlhA
MTASVTKITDKEEAQKFLLPLMAKLALAKNKFLSMASKNKDKTEEEGGSETEEGTATETKEDDATPSQEKAKLPSEYATKDLKFRAEKAAKEAFENAERIAKNVATKVGIIKVPASDTKEETEEEGIEVKLEEETTAAPAVTDDEETKAE